MVHSIAKGWTGLSMLPSQKQNLNQKQYCHKFNKNFKKRSASKQTEKLKVQTVMDPRPASAASCSPPGFFREWSLAQKPVPPRFGFSTAPCPWDYGKTLSSPCLSFPICPNGDTINLPPGASGRRK